MPNQDSKFACCTLPNGDEWHLEFSKIPKLGSTILRILIPEEKLKEAGIALRSRGGNWYATLPSRRGSDGGALIDAGPFTFKSITFPK